MTDYIDIHRIDKQYKRKLDKIKNNTKLSKRNKDLILQYLKDSELGKTIKKGQKKKINSGRNLQVSAFLIQMCRDWFKKDLDKVNQNDMETFILALDRGEILSARGKPYSSESKSNIKKFIRKFYKWLLGNGRTYPELVDWIDTSKRDAEVKALPGLKNGVWKIVELIPSLRKKALVWCCFDSGFREGEILNCRIKDVEKREDGIYYITCRHSKTKPRTVSLPYSSELLDKWLKEHPQRNDPESQLWQTSRVMFYRAVKLYSKKALGTPATVHMLRHSSATFWGPKLDRVNFCKRFGWSYNSSSPDRYLDFAKVSQNKTVDLVKAEKYDLLKAEFDEQKIKNLKLHEEMAEMKQMLKKITAAMTSDEDSVVPLMEGLISGQK